VTFASLLDRYGALPRSMRWLSWLVALLVGYFAVVEPLLDWRNTLEARADALAASLAREQELNSSSSSAGSTIAVSRAMFGVPLLPGPDAARKQAFSARVNAIFRDHHVTPRITERQTPVRDSQAASLVDPEYRVERLVLDLSFEAPPETVTAILAELEKSEEVSAVGRLSVRKATEGQRPGAREAPSRVVRAQISVETWLSVKSTAPAVGAAGASAGLARTGS
jgi:hypothetical protein